MPIAPTFRLSAAGFAATLVTYGPARIGFGLFLPEFRAVFSISTETAGFIAGLGFGGLLLGLVAAYAMAVRWGPRLPVLLGLAAATGGMAIVAAAQGLGLLALGVLVAMSSAGFSWAPFNDAVHADIRDARRPVVLSVISTGTSLGIAAAGTATLLLSIGGGSWRIAWAGFALAGAVALVANALALRGGRAGSGHRPARPWGVLGRRPVITLYAVALSFGATSAIYISFAADRVAQAGGLAPLPGGAAAAVIFIAYGVCGLCGMAAGHLRELMELSRLLRLLLAAAALSLLLVALAPAWWPTVVLSAGLQGVFVMTMSAILAFWSERLFPGPSTFGFTAVLLVVAAGSVIGPMAAGLVAGAFGAAAMFAGAAAIAALSLAIALPRFVSERALEI